MKYFIHYDKDSSNENNDENNNYNKHENKNKTKILHFFTYKIL